MINKDKIEELKKELAKYSQHDDIRLKSMQEQQKIKDLKKQIRAKKYESIIRTGKRTGRAIVLTGRGIRDVSRSGKKVIVKVDQTVSKFMGKPPSVDKVMKMMEKLEK